jgi:magnesium chelatase family protein
LELKRQQLQLKLTWIRVIYHLVGLPDNAIKRVVIALLLRSKQYLYHAWKKITINMAPADLRKEGSAYDLTLAIGI